MRFTKGLEYSFDDVLLLPQFSEVKSRKDVDTSSVFLSNTLRLPIISSNMDTVTNSPMAKAMLAAGGIGCLHRFQSIQDNVTEFINSSHKAMVSVGIGTKELERAKALYDAGAKLFVIDVAHGANAEVVIQAKELRRIFGSNAALVVGNFATARGIKDFLYRGGGLHVDAWKVGIGGGSACTTRIVTGCGLSTFASVVDCAAAGYDVIADGGIRNSGDVAKALAAGAKAVMLGRMLAGTDESPGQPVYDTEYFIPSSSSMHVGTTDGYAYYDNTTVSGSYPIKAKRYRGSASAESYGVQEKTAEWRAPEGEAFEVPYVGSVASVMQKIDGGLRSAMSYVGAKNLEEFRENAEFAVVSAASAAESKAHGKT
jgi:IMP dehydrogenase